MRNKALLVLFFFASLALVGWSGYGQGSKRQAWEYKSFALLIRASGSVLYENGKAVPGKADTLEKAQELGAQGWELMSVTSIGDSVIHYWFKRAK
jgi:hypothetical protein